MRRSAAALALALSFVAAACGQKASTSTAASAPAAPAAPAPPAAAVQDLAPAAFVATVADPNAIVLDVRTPEEFAAGHVRGATNIDVTAPDFAQNIAALDPGKTYVLYCRSGNRSARAAAQMQAAGFASLFNAGGFDALAAAGVPTE